MRYYEYLSARKVEMLYAQLDSAPHTVKRTQIGVNAKFAEYRRETERTLGDDDSVYSKLNAVEQQIRADGSVGSATEPATWISAHTHLVEGRYEDLAILYAGQVGDSIMLMYGALGHASPGLNGPSEPLRNARVSGAGWIEELIANEPLPTLSPEPRTGPGPFDVNRASRIGMFAKILLASGRPIGECEVLARRFHSFPYGDGMLTLAGPIFVAPTG
ncbi:MAG: DUF7019 family protein [Trebonia sp.]